MTACEVTFAITDVPPDIVQMLTGKPPPPQVERAILFRYEKAVPLRTGKRGSRSRVEHARHLRLARLRRRLAHRAGRPAKVIRYQTYLPRVWIREVGQ